MTTSTLHAHPPGLLRRLAAMLYDALLVAALVVSAFALVYLPLAMGLGWKDLNAHPWMRHALTLWMLAVAVGFHLWFWTHGGQTLGMRAWRLRLVSADGGPVTLRQAVVRYLTALLSWLALGLGFLWVWIDSERRAWHDLASDTRLVLVERDR